MRSRLSLSLLLAAVAMPLAWPAAPAHVQAGEPGDLLIDTDDDLLPDCVEWAVLTSATTPDTDGDMTPDFVEVVQRGTPRESGGPLPLDQEMRVVITGPQPGALPITWMHLLLRLADPTSTVETFQAWLEVPSLPGLRIHFDMFSLAPAILKQRDMGAHGIWVRLSVPLASTELLRYILPCSIHAESQVGGRYLRSGVNLFDIAGSIATIVPFGERFAVQTIAPTIGNGGLTNRVCVVELTNSGSGLAGTAYTITAADCEDCNELECPAADCSACLNWVILIPGGLGVLTNQ